MNKSKSNRGKKVSEYLEEAVGLADEYFGDMDNWDEQINSFILEVAKMLQKEELDK